MEADDASFRWEEEFKGYEVIKEGVLMKRKGALNLSTRRHTVLEVRPDGLYLAYHDATKEGNPGELKGVLPLAGAAVEIENEKFSVTVNQPGHKNHGKKIVFGCQGGEAEAQQWLDMILARTHGQKRSGKMASGEIPCDKLIKVLAPGIIREGASTDSNKIGQMVVGKEMRVTAESRLEGGIHRYRLDIGGWVSAISLKGHALVEVLRDNTESLESGQVNADKSAALRALEGK